MNKNKETEVAYTDLIKQIDNKEVETIKVLDSLLAIDCEPGKHKITLEYKNNFIKSTIISITTFIILISIPIIKHIKKKN